jgi:Skp family chaperone for outer membrane proteins
MMKFKVLLLLLILYLLGFDAYSQRGVRIGYIDTEYILQNVPEYQEASAQLDKKALQWKTDIEKKLSVIEQKKKELDNESVLLTKELYEERYEDITFEEAEIIDLQQKRFGPNGDLMIQKRQLIEPIQDQIFAAVQEIAATKKFDFIFDKSADVVMLYSAERYDVSEQVLRIITRTSRRSQAKSKKERQALEEEDVVPIVNTEKDERQKQLDDRKAQREAELAERRAERERAIEERQRQQEELRAAKKREAEERRQRAIDARNSKNTSTESAAAAGTKTAPTPSDNSEKSSEPTTSKKISGSKEDTKAKTTKPDSTKTKGSMKVDTSSTKKTKPKTAAEIQEEQRQQKIRDREARQRELEERKQRIIEQRRKAREEREAKARKNDSIAKAKKENGNN